MNSGAYRLLIEIDKPVEILVGALGLISFPAGKYIYTGSAMKNLRQRVARHLSKEKKVRWHIDYLLDFPDVRIAGAVVYPSLVRNECNLVDELAAREDINYVIPHFGSSDCKKCKSHLLIAENAIFEELKKDLLEF